MNTSHEISADNNSRCTQVHKTTISTRSLYDDTSRPDTSSCHQPDSTLHLAMKRLTCDVLHPRISNAPNAATVTSPSRRHCNSMVTPKRMKSKRGHQLLRMMKIRRRLNFDVIKETLLETERMESFNKEVSSFLSVLLRR